MTIIQVLDRRGENQKCLFASVNKNSDKMELAILRAFDEAFDSLEDEDEDKLIELADELLEAQDITRIHLTELNIEYL